MSSKLPELVELVMAKPLISAGMVAKTLEETTQAARRIVLELGLRERKGGDTVLGGFSKGNRVLRSACGGNDCSPDKLDGSFANPICASLVVTGGDEMALIWSRRPAGN
ncbi:hypothetical protein GCM10008012_19130 [Rhizobium anhuiense]|nr:hypothetical protein GCM10008012_19130 [Rhizobium anhuiense]